MKKIIIVLAVLFYSVGLSYADEGKISGYLFGDYYGIGSHNNEALEGLSGFMVRRIYLGYDRKLDNNFSTKLRLEMNNAGDYVSSTKMTPAVKDAYLKWKPSKHSVIFGLSGTPTWGVIEKFWGYRSVEKTPLDLQKFGSSSRDMGIAFKGSFDAEKKYGYHLMAGNGNSNKSENDGHKKGYLSLYAKPVKGLIIELYGDYAYNKGEASNTAWNDEASNTSWYTLQGFIGIGNDNNRIGLQWARQTRQQGQNLQAKNNPDQYYSVGSIFGVFKIMDKLNVLGRVDHTLEPIPGADGIDYIPMDATERTTFAVLGFDYEAAENIHFIPNVEAVFYKNDNRGNLDNLDEDIYYRLTVFYKF